jgi:hypothetical protein
MTCDIVKVIKSSPRRERPFLFAGVSIVPVSQNAFRGWSMQAVRGTLHASGDYFFTNGEAGERQWHENIRRRHQPMSSA